MTFTRGAIRFETRFDKGDIIPAKSLHEGSDFMVTDVEIDDDCNVIYSMIEVGEERITAVENEIEQNWEPAYNYCIANVADVEK